MIILGDPNVEQAQMFQQGLLNTLGMLAQQQLQNEYLQKQYDFRKKMLDYKHQLADQERNKIINDLLGYQTSTIELKPPNPISNNPIENAVKGFLNPSYQAPITLKDKINSVLPKPEIAQKQIKGLLSDGALKGMPTVKDYLVAQAYGFNLPKVEKPKKKQLQAKVVGNEYFTFNPETGEWAKKGEVKKVIKENSQRMLVDTGDKKLLIDKKDGKVIKEYPVKKGSGSKGKSTKFNQYYSRLLALRKQLRAIETGRMVDEMGQVIPIPEDKKQALREQVIKDINLTLDIMEKEDPEKYEVIKKRLMKDPVFNDILLRTPANLSEPNMPAESALEQSKPKKKKTYNPLQIFEVD